MKKSRRWSAISPDFAPLGYFLWRYLKGNVYFVMKRKPK